MIGSTLADSQDLDRLALTVDLGTGGPKVGVTTLAGEVLRWASSTVQSQVTAAGASTQDADVWWQTIAGLARELLNGLDPARVAAVTVTGQWGSTVPVDDAGRPVGQCVMWDDTRGAAHVQQRFGGPVEGYRPTTLATYLRRAGGVPNLSGADPTGHLLHLRRDQPEVHRRARWLMEPVDYLTFRLTGRPTATPASMAAAWLTDNRDLSRVGYDDRLVALSGVDPDRLPPLVPTGSVLGEVLPGPAAEWDLPPGIAVITGIPDLHMTAVGAGALGPGVAHLSIGTTAWLSMQVDRKHTDVLNQMASLPGVTEGRYLIGNNQDSAGRCLEWFRSSLTPLAGRELSIEELLEAAEGVPPGSGGVLFTPWLTGERCPVDDHRARAGFHNISRTVSHAELTRAVLEGVALNARWMLRGVERFAGHRLDRIRLVGGGARSDLWCQIAADALDRQVLRVSEPFLTGLRGGGLFAALTLGLLRPEEVEDLVSLDPPFEPGAGAAALAAHAPELPRLHRAQRRFFRRMNPR